MQITHQIKVHKNSGTTANKNLLKKYLTLPNRDQSGDPDICHS